MPIEPFYIDEDDRPIQTFLIDPALYPVFYIDPVTDNPPPGTGGGGGGGTVLQLEPLCRPNLRIYRSQRFMEYDSGGLDSGDV